MIDTQHLAQRFPAADSIPGEHPLAREIHQRSYLVGGRLETWSDRCKTLLPPVCTRQPDGRVEQVPIGSYPVMGEAQSDAALNAAVAAYANGRGERPTMPAGGLIACMHSLVKGMVERREAMVNLILWEMGKSLADSRKEFDRTVEYMQATIDALKDMDSGHSRFTVVEGTIGQVRHTPLGVVLYIGPYNNQLNETFCTLIPALLMGNTVVLKPPQYGTSLFEPLLEVFRDAFSAGAVNTVYAPGKVVVPRMPTLGEVNVLALIGASRVADHLKKQHPKSHRQRAVLGLDAKNAAILLPDADLDLAVKECLLGALSLNGQRCTDLKMLIVHRSIVDAFLQRFVAELARLKVGMPWESGVHITPQPGPHREGGALQRAAAAGDERTRHGAGAAAGRWRDATQRAAGRHHAGRAAGLAEPARRPGPENGRRERPQHDARL